MRNGRCRKDTQTERAGQKGRSRTIKLLRTAGLRKKTRVREEEGENRRNRRRLYSSKIFKRRAGHPQQHESDKGKGGEKKDKLRKRALVEELSQGRSKKTGR